MTQHLDHDWWPRPLPDNVEIHPRAWLHSGFALRHCRSRAPTAVRIDADTGVYPGTCFDLGSRGEVRIGRCSTLVAPIIASNGAVVIGDHVFIAHDVHLVDRPVALPPDERPDADLSLAIELHDDVWIGARAIIVAPARLERGVVVGAGTVVTGEVPPFSIVAGSPARVIGRAEPGTAR